jgi:hypothetical protein
VAVTVDAAMNGWGDYVRAGKATAADEEAVKSAYEKYQAAMRTARAITHSYLDSGAVDSAPLIEAIRALDGAKTELLALINLFAHPL